MDRTEVLIIGAGLAGLSTAYHLRRPYILLEKEETPGGLCRSVHSGGSVYDYTGHLLHLRRKEIVRLVEELLPGRLRRIERKASIFTQGCFLPYPFQANFHPLPKEVVKECLLGFIKAREEKKTATDSFGDWALATFGEGICRHFMFPYNEKLFCRPAEEMTAEWVSWSVPQPELETVVDGALGTTAHGLGYNATFLYPKEGGIEILPQALAAQVGGVSYGQEVFAIDVVSRIALTPEGKEFGYEQLVSTMPLTQLLSCVKTEDENILAMKNTLRWVNVYNINFTIQRKAPWGWHWLYLPDSEFVCYRIGVASNFSPALAPEDYSAVYTEVSYKPGKKPDEKIVRQQVVEDLQKLELLTNDSEIVDETALTIEPAYVIYDKARSENLDLIHSRLLGYDIHSIGRWGRWEYSAMEDALLQGLQTAAKLNSR